jgi:hypothetical protein
MTTTTMNDTIPALVKAVRPFANRSRRVAALHDALVRIDGGTTLVQATDLEIACTVAACTPDADPGAMLFDSANGERVTDRDPLEFPSVGRLAGETVATFVIGIGDVRRLARHVATAADNESSRYALGGVLIERDAAGAMIAVGTDGRRMHVATIPAAEATGAPAANCIVPNRLFAAFDHAVRTAVAATTGCRGRRLDATIDGEAVTMTITPTGIRLAWQTATLSVEADARVMEGRFPRWRDIVATLPTGTDNHLDGASLARWLRSVDRQTQIVADGARDHHAAREVARTMAGKGASPAALAKAHKAAATAYRHPRGVRFSTDGVEALGCEMKAGIPFASRTMLDPAFAAGALDAAVAFGGSDEVAVRVGQPMEAVTITAGGFLAVMMPMVDDA